MVFLDLLQHFSYTTSNALLPARLAILSSRCHLWISKICLSIFNSYDCTCITWMYYKYSLRESHQTLGLIEWRWWLAGPLRYSTGSGPFTKLCSPFRIWLQVSLSRVLEWIWRKYIKIRGCRMGKRWWIMNRLPEYSRWIHIFLTFRKGGEQWMAISHFVPCGRKSREGETTKHNVVLVID